MPSSCSSSAAHAGHLVQALAGQGEQPDDRPERFVDRVASPPQPADFVAVQHALAGLRCLRLVYAGARVRGDAALPHAASRTGCSGRRAEPARAPRRCRDCAQAGRECRTPRLAERATRCHGRRSRPPACRPSGGRGRPGSATGLRAAARASAPSPASAGSWGGHVLR